jgi:membrane dipeptidase
VFDGHTDVPTRLHEAPADLARRQEDRHVDLPRLREGGVGGLVCALFVPHLLDPVAGLAHARQLWQATRSQLAPGGLELATSTGELAERRQRGAVAVVLGLENGRPLSVPGAMDELVGCGVRIVTLTHVGSHEWCDAAGDAEVHGGLAPAGEDVVRQLNRRGVVVDVSHVSDRACAHVLATSAAPVVASHSSARALCDHPRNLPDDLARQIGSSGGLVMVNAYPAFLDERAAAVHEERAGHFLALLAAEAADGGDPAAFARERERLLAAHPLPAVALERYVDHIVYLVALLGPEAVGIGTDFDGISDVPVGFEHPGRFPALAARLRERGLGERELGLVLGGNFLRLFAAVERCAAA